MTQNEDRQPDGLDVADRPAAAAPRSSPAPDAPPVYPPGEVGPDDDISRATPSLGQAAEDWDRRF